MKKEKKTSICGGIKKSIFKIILLGGVVLSLLGADQINTTNSFFSDLATTENNRVSAGVWIPTLTMEVNPENPNGNNGWYVSQPCVKLFSDIDDVTIYYSLVGGEGATPKMTVDEGVCILIPEGRHTIYAWAENNANPSWASETISKSFKVDTQCPRAKITNPKDGETLRGEVEIKGTVEDENPHHYWLVIENEAGSRVAGPGVVIEGDSFSDAKLFNWESENFEDGKYTIKLEARDEAGNKCPNLAPVPSDPETEGDSVDWIEVEIDNHNQPTYQKGDILINEIMWMGSSAGKQDEWIELYNTTDDEIDLKNWKLENVRGSAGNQDYSFPASRSILAKSYLILSNNPQNSNNTALGVTVNVSNANLELNDSNHGKIILKDPTGQVIDEVDASAGWPAGEIESVGPSETYYRSMQRDSTNLASWCTAEDESLNDAGYWKEGEANYGSPRAANICGETNDGNDDLGGQEQPIGGDGDNSKEEKKPVYLGQVVINEFLPNPASGNDDDKMPGGEWVELYNKSDVDVDVAGWYLYDSHDNHFMKISLGNSDNNGNTTDSGETTIPAHGWLVVYRNGDSDFSLNNNSDEIRLFDGKINEGGILIDSYSYSGRDYSSLTPTPGAANGNDQSGGSGNNIPQGKSFVRYPDGSDNWIDPVPTPGKANSDSNDLEAFQEFYEPLCFGKKGEPICDIEFMYLIGLLEKGDEELELEEVAEVPTGEELLKERDENKKELETKEENEEDEAKKGDGGKNKEEDDESQVNLEATEDGSGQNQTDNQVSGDDAQAIFMAVADSEKTANQTGDEENNKANNKLESETGSVQSNESLQAEDQSENSQKNQKKKEPESSDNKKPDDNENGEDNKKETASLKDEEEDEEVNKDDEKDKSDKKDKEKEKEEDNEKQKEKKESEEE